MKRSYIIAAILAAGAVAWVASGQVADGGRVPAAQKPPVRLDDADRLPRVRVRRQVAEEWATELVLRGRTEAERVVEVRAETDGRVVALDVEEGAAVEAKAEVARLDPDERPAVVKEAEALLEQRQIEFEADRRLAKKGFRAETKLASSRAALQAAEAALTRARVELSHTRILAPFAGIVEDYLVEIGDFVKKGDPIMRVVDLDPIIIVAQVAERDLGRIAPGSAGRARLITGQEVEGRLRYRGTMADPTTRTFRIELEVANRGGDIPDGATAELRIPLDGRPAHWVSPAVLTLSDQGLVGVKLVEDGNRVTFHPVEILESGPGGMWIGGLPEEVVLITVGQEFVTEGQVVEPVEEGGPRQTKPVGGQS